MKNPIKKFKSISVFLSSGVAAFLFVCGCGVKPMILYMGDGMQYLNHENLRVVHDSLGVRRVLRTHYYVGSVFETIKVDTLGNGLFYCTLKRTWHGASPLLYPMARCGDKMVFWSLDFKESASELLNDCGCAPAILDLVSKLDSVGPYYWMYVGKLKAIWEER
jgi:hypothetical protein